jgi:hypothetical protein
MFMKFGYQKAVGRHRLLTLLRSGRSQRWRVLRL